MGWTKKVLGCLPCPAVPATSAQRLSLSALVPRSLANRKERGKPTEGTRDAPAAPLLRHRDGILPGVDVRGTARNKPLLPKPLCSACAASSAWKAAP